MPIKQKHDGLPRGPVDDGSVHPDPDPWIGRALAEAWLTKHYEADKAHAIEGSRFRASMAGGCTRALAFYFADMPKSDPPDAASMWRMELGTMIHEAMQTIMLDAFPGAEIEVQAPIMDGLGSMHIDLVVDRPLEQLRGHAPDGELDLIKASGRDYWRSSIEVKSINGYGFKMAATAFKGPMEGPKDDHLLQAALGGVAVDADEIIVCYLSMENVSPDLAKYCDDPVFGKFTAQWSFPRDSYVPMAVAEEKRVRYVAEKVPPKDTDTKKEQHARAAAARAVPAYIRNDHGVIAEVHPLASGQLVKHDRERNALPAGKTWRCGYCDWRSACPGE